MKPTVRARRAFTLVEIMIVILIIGVLLAIAVPNFISSRSRSRQRTCQTNMRQLNGAKEQFAMEHSKNSGDAVVSGDLVPVYIKEFPICPEGGTYTLNTVGTSVACSENSGGYAHVIP